MHTISEPVVVEARAKITWGENPQNVLAFLQSHHVGDKDALELVEALMQERAASIRADGIKKASTGAVCLVIPIAYYFVGQWAGIWSLNFFAALVVLGVFGLVKLTRGLSMALRPRSVTADLANAEL